MKKIYVKELKENTILTNVQIRNLKSRKWKIQEETEKLR